MDYWAWRTVDRSKPHCDLTRAMTPAFWVRHGRKSGHLATNRSRPPDLLLHKTISRQAFLCGAAGMLASGGVFGTARAAADPAAGWDGLASSIGGIVLVPANGSAFTSGKQVFNSFFSDSNPAAAVRVSSQADVQKAIAFATANNLKVAPRGGGHSYVGASSANGSMVLDLRGLPGGANFERGQRQRHGQPGNQYLCAATGLGRRGTRRAHRELPDRRYRREWRSVAAWGPIPDAPD